MTLGVRELTLNLEAAGLYRKYALPLSAPDLLQLASTVFDMQYHACPTCQQISPLPILYANELFTSWDLSAFCKRCEHIWSP